MGPGLLAISSEILGVRLNEAFDFAGFFNRERQTLALGVRDGLLAAIEMQANLPGCIVDTGPAHNGIA